VRKPEQNPEPLQVSSYPSSAVYMNSCTPVGRKFMLLDACSILTVYSGVDICELAVTKAAAVHTILIAITPIRSQFLFILFTSYYFSLLVRNSFKSYGFIEFSVSVYLIFSYILPSIVR
jgi:hypothetical protein